MSTMPTTSTSHPAIDEALRAALFYLQAMNIPDVLTLRSILAACAVRLLDKARAEITKSEGADHAL